MMESMSGRFSRVDSRIRHARVDVYGAELDLRTRAATIFWHRSGQTPLVVGEGTWVPLPEPMGDLRGRLVVEGLHRRTCALLEHQLARGNRDWTYEKGPWIGAEASARAAGVEAQAADALRKVLWLFYRNCWPLQFADGCGWGSRGYGPLIAAALADPIHMRARWELLILTGALQWPASEGDLERIAGDSHGDEFYAAP
ncbi:hypothetical protein SAMN02745121_05426 [Nannocystis exedens]|uniref:Uncharacterized protein n=2 Tax=Nannocystis exedens TaxID=54 RepID=A0A1I2D721_9BACT|nr:hypothetical protein NAEX_03753 [Nannocystis exedens]SFE76336.1 hypothetical protein SAMN02745121_05426 [Nannocystis exedens]